MPPPVSELKAALSNFEAYLVKHRTEPVLFHCAIAHAQFETIHPFLDGNGRLGRLLITFLLCQRQVLGRPLLYISSYLKKHRTRYYDHLMRVRTDGDWEGWIKFFLRGVYEVSLASARTGREIVQMRESHRDLVQNKCRGAKNSLRLLETLYQQPIISAKAAVHRLGITDVTVRSLINQLEALGLLEEITGRSRDRLYKYAPYLALFEDDEAAT